MKVLIIKSDINSFETEINRWFKECQYDLITVSSITKNKNGIKKRLVVLHSLKNIDFSPYDKVIIFDNSLIYLYCHLFVKWNKLFFWLWNTVESNGSKIRFYLCKIFNNTYSFDTGDVYRYKLKFNTQFYYRSAQSENNSIKEHYSVYFVGADKGRYEFISKLAYYLDENNILYNFNIIADKNRVYNNNKIICEKFFDYHDICTTYENVDAILEVCKPGQEGMTLRLMEALFYNKKLITNNEHYRELPFYNPKNIFIINEKNFSELLTFLKTPMDLYDETMKNYYSIENWLRRFQ